MKIEIWLMLFVPVVLFVAAFAIDPATDLGVSNTFVDVCVHYAEEWGAAERSSFESAWALRMLAILIFGVGVGQFLHPAKK